MQKLQLEVRRVCQVANLQKIARTHRREIKDNKTSIGRHFNSEFCSNAKYSLQILDQSPDYQMDSLLSLEGFYSGILPEVFEEGGGNSREEGKNVRKNKINQ